MLLQSYNKSLTTNTKSELNYLFFYFFFKISQLQPIIFFFFFNDPATTEISPLPLPDALPICKSDETAEALRSIVNAGHRRSATVGRVEMNGQAATLKRFPVYAPAAIAGIGSLPDTILDRSEEHTSELQSRLHLVCRLLLEKKK